MYTLIDNSIAYTLLVFLLVFGPMAAMLATLLMSGSDDNVDDDVDDEDDDIVEEFSDIRSPDSVTCPIGMSLENEDHDVATATCCDQITAPRNYKDPRDMSCMEKVDFKRKYRNNFTMQDYIDWLLLYRRDMYNLKEYHQANLIKVLSGTKLKAKDLPYRRLVPSMESSKYFAEMYNKQGKLAYHGDDLEAGGLLGANYSDYNEFIPPQLLRHSWITGKKDLFVDQKNDTYALNYYLRPAAVVGD